MLTVALWCTTVVSILASRLGLMSRHTSSFLLKSCLESFSPNLAEVSYLKMILRLLRRQLPFNEPRQTFLLRKLFHRQKFFLYLQVFHSIRWWHKLLLCLCFKNRWSCVGRASFKSPSLLLLCWRGFESLRRDRQKSKRCHLLHKNKSAVWE